MAFVKDKILDEATRRVGTLPDSSKINIFHPLKIFVMLETILISGISAIIGGFISFFLQHLKHKQEMQKLFEGNKTEFMAETTAKYFLSHKTHIERSFITLKQHLGGFDDNELRRILVRAGAIRTFRNGNENEEWWRLLSRQDEYIERKKTAKEETTSEN